MKTLSTSILIFCSYLLIGITFACRNEKKNTVRHDNFYTRTNSSWDAIRIPLIEPFELLQLNGHREWSMNLNETPSSITNVKHINVYKDIIIIHSGETYCNSEKVQEAWFIISPQHKLEIGFVSKQKFNKYALSQHLVNPVFYNVDTVYDFFYKKGELDWGIDFK